MKAAIPALAIALSVQVCLRAAAPEANLPRQSPAFSGAKPGSQATAGGAKPIAVPTPAANDPFALIGPDYKKPVELPDTFFNPFKVAGAGGAAVQKKGGEGVTNQVVSEAMAHRGVSGVLYAASGADDRAIIGDQVFALGEELSFPDGDKGGLAPLVAGATVVLRAIGAESLSLDVTPEGEPTRPMTYSLRAFLRP
jgi:hypothetical protein